LQPRARAPLALRAVEQAERAHGPALALQVERRYRLEPRVVAHEPVRLAAHQDLAGRGGLLETRRDVQRVADEQVGGLRRVDHDLAGVDPDPGLDADVGERILHLERRPHRAQGIVLVHLWNPEDGHDRVADELGDGAAVALDDVLHPREVSGEEGAQRLGIGRFAKRSRAGDVAEENRYGLSLLP